MFVSIILGKKRSSRQYSKNAKLMIYANCFHQFAEEPQLNIILKVHFSLHHCKRISNTSHRTAEAITSFVPPSLDTNDSVLLHLAATFLCSSLLFPPQVLFYYHFLI